LGSILTVGESSGSEEPAGWPHPHRKGLLEGAGRGAKNGAAANFTEAPATILRKAAYLQLFF
jgi:hypothetical protein